MNRKLLAAGLIILAGVLCAGLFKGYQWLTKEDAEIASSDATGRSAVKMKIAGDPYLGYFFLRSPQMKAETRKRGLAVEFSDDGGNYAERLDKFNKGEYDGIVLPINSYLKHGEKFKYPGVIVSAIAESKGADAVACFQEKLPTGAVNDLNDAGLQIVYTAESPSSFLLDLAIRDFGLDNLSKVDTWRVEVAGSEQAFAKAKRHEGDCFVMWEPDFSRALHEVPGLKKVWGSDQFADRIVDVFVFRRDVVANRLDDLTTFFTSYFSAMRTYGNNSSLMVDDMKAVFPKLQKSEIEGILKSKEIHWYDLNENLARQFGIETPGGGAAEKGVITKVALITDFMLSSKKWLDDPLGGKFEKIVNSKVLPVVAEALPNMVGGDLGRREFTALSEDEWRTIKDSKKGFLIGVMKVEPITFQSGSAVLSSAGEEQVDKIAQQLINVYPDNRIIVRGHTAKGASEKSNVDLSQARAEAVMQRLIQTHGISPNRLRAEGMGSSQPPTQRPDENARQYQYRIPRVEFVLFSDPARSF